MKLTIREDLKSLIPPLSDDEYSQLEENIITDGCRDPLVVWGDVIVDGHNRYDICTRLNIPFKTVQREFESVAHARVWMRDNQKGRRNLTAAWLIELELGRKDDLLEIAGINKKAKLFGNKNAAKVKTKLSPSDNTVFDHLPDEEEWIEPPIYLQSPTARTRTEIAKAAGVSSGQVGMAEQIKKKAPELWEAAKAGDISIKKAYTQIQREVKRAETIEKLNDINTQETKKLEGKYDVIVIDPPWPMEKIERDVRPNQSEFDYPTMSEAELASMEMPAGDSCHLWLWTTHKFMPMAFRLLDSWGFKYVCAFVWHKSGGFQPIGLPQYNCEFALYARKGTPIFVDTKAFNTCFNAGRGAHSEKPEEFYDVIRRVTSGARIDIFNRRAIDGFDTWGKEAQ